MAQQKTDGTEEATWHSKRQISQIKKDRWHRSAARINRYANDEVNLRPPQNVQIDFKFRREKVASIILS